MRCKFGCGTEVTTYKVNGEHEELLGKRVDYATLHTRTRCSGALSAQLAAVRAELSGATKVVETVRAIMRQCGAWHVGKDWRWEHIPDPDLLCLAFDALASHTAAQAGKEPHGKQG